MLYGYKLKENPSQIEKLESTVWLNRDQIICLEIQYWSEEHVLTRAEYICGITGHASVIMH